MPTFAVVGSGGWGTAVALHLARTAGNRVRLWSARPAAAAALAESRENARQLPGVAIPDAVTLTADPGEAVDGADCWVVAVPTAYLRATVERFHGFPPAGVVVSLTKGIERETFRRPTEVIADVLGVPDPVALSGPSHAEEVARGLPTSLVAASADAAAAAWVQRHVGGPRLRVYTNPDVVGVELAGALKNVIGVAAGVCDGFGFGDNAKAALITRGLVEMARFGVEYGADPATFSGLAGLGDLTATCFSRHGRNRAVGEQLARGTATLAEVLARPQVAEGVFTARAVAERRTPGVDLPVITGVYEVLFEGKSPAAAMGELLARQQRGENTFLG